MALGGIIGVDLGKLIEIKIASLLHDPPCKAYSIKGAVHSRAQSYGGGHEGDARAIASDLGLLEILKKHWSTVKAIDALASSFDRMLLPYKDRFDKPSRTILINIFDPSICLGVGRICIDLGNMRSYVAKALPKYISELKEILDSVNDPILRYHLLWTLLEPLWFKYCDRMECISPADTRVPTHTVFDHVYATAMTANIYDGRDFHGYAVVIDFAGVQNYISESRKLRDLWASSWIGSLLGWIAIEPLIAILGPDIIVSPSLRGNWFYLAWLHAGLSRVASGIVDKIKEVMWNSYRYPGWPRFPIMPTRLFLFMPRITSVPDTKFTREYSDVVEALVKGDIEDIRRIILEYIREKWRSIVGYLEPFMRILVESTYKVYNVDEKDIDSVVQKAIDLASSIPLPVRIVIIDLEKEYNGYLKWLESRGFMIRDNKIYARDSREKEVEVCERNALFYHYIVAERLPLLEGIYKLSRIEPGIDKDWRLPDQIVRKLGFCSVCGRRLAIAGALRTDYDKFNDEIKEVTDKLLRRYRGSDYEDYIDRFRQMVVLGEGERLCPVCLVKRLISFFYMIVLKHLGLEYPSAREEFWIPSVSDIANIEAIKEIIKYLRDIHEKYVNLLRRNPLVFGCRRIDSGGLPRRLYIDADIESLLKVYRKIYEHDPLLKGLSDTLFKDHLGSIMEAVIDRETYRKMASLVDKVSGEIRVVYEETRKIIDGLYKKKRSTRFAIIRGDGDRIGSGLLQGVLGFNGEEYIRRIISHLPDYWRRNRSVVNEWMRRVRLVNGRLNIDRERSIAVPVTPAYHYSLSRALSLIAIRDALITEGYYGVIVYTGGDDILAISPAYAKVDGKAMIFIPLEIVKRTRRNYWGEENIHRDRPLYKGFIVSLDHELRDPSRISVISPSIRVYGRTYSIVISHHRDPLYISMKHSIHLEEYAKEHTVFINLGGFASSDTDIITTLANHIGKSTEELSNIVRVYGIQDLLCTSDIECLCRDHLAILETHSGEVSVLPLGPLGNLSICQSIDLANIIINELGLVGRRSRLSTSVLYDVYMFYKDMNEISKDLRFNELDKIFNHIIERNMRISGGREPLKELFKHIISDSRVLTRFYELVDRPSGILIGGVEYGSGLFKHYPFILQLFSTARIAKKSMK